MKKKSLMTFMDRHQGLEELFLQHQEELICLKLKKAKVHLEAFAKELRHHMYIEEKYVLPLYEKKVPQQPGGGAFLFYGEHQKMKDFLNKIISKMKKLSAKNKMVRRQVIDLLDLETRFKDILLHHDLREKNMLYPKLDKVVTPEEREKLLAA